MLPVVCASHAAIKLPIESQALKRAAHAGGAPLLVVLLSTFQLSRYIILPCGSALHVLLHQEAQPRDICQAYMQVGAAH